MLNKIVITSDFENLKAKLEAEFGVNNLRFFISDDFLLENAKEVIAEAYIAEKDEKILVIEAKSFRTEAQNALLKIIEEPPRNIKFIIVTQSKNLLLPTIRSRMLIENKLQSPVIFDLICNGQGERVKLGPQELIIREYPNYRLREDLVMDVKVLEGRTPHKRVIVQKDEPSYYLKGAFVYYDGGYPDLRLRREG